MGDPTPAPPPTPAPGPACCGNCARSPWCSPGSGSCYQSKNKDYYESCPVDPTPAPPPTPAPVPACCGNCAGSPWCSPGSGSCYQSKSKDYYESCPFDLIQVLNPLSPANASTPSPAPLPECCGNCAGSPWCSPGSGNCYTAQTKTYYENCPVVPTPAPPPADPSACNPVNIQ